MPSTSVLSLWRHPIKSMGGEELEAAVFTPGGMLGDRALGLIDESGTLVSAKNPRKWPAMFALSAAFQAEPRPDSPLPPVRITLPDGDTLGSDQPDVDARLSSVLGRPVTLRSVPPERPAVEMLWPDLDGRGQEKVTVENLPAGAFFDLAPVHLLTTATLEQFGRLHPQGRFNPRRFRPNLVLALDARNPFPEREWVGRTLVIGEEVRLRVTQPCGRCVMTTLPQGDLPRDPDILRTAVAHNEGNVGVYATVLRGGIVRRGDGVEVMS
jgi:uncharacterized protein